ncbi:PREDICTED: ryanodine receptor 1-like, partial [Calidris pugnax]|uniref:ryanodine receptor 1-like n=1 Tax=Calidris pugnax TaxID=198806 RepID=UPI00071C87DD
MVGEVFIYWSKSHNFKREEQNFVVQNEINNMSFLTADSKSKMAKGGGSEQERTKKKRRGDRYSVQTSLIVATLKKMLPIGLNMCSPTDQELITLAKGRYALKDTDEEVREFLNNNLHLQGKCENNSSMRWQMALYREMAGKAEDSDSPEKIVRRVQEVSAVLYHLEQGGGSEQERTKKKRRGDRYSVQTSLIVATLKKMLPIGLNMCSPTDQELITLAKGRYALKDTDEEVREFLNNNLHLQGKCENNSSMRWQMALYREMAGKAEDSDSPEKIVRRVQEVSAVLYHLEQTEHPYKSKKAVWHKLLSKQRRRAVVACFRMTPLYNLPRCGTGSNWE